MAHTAAVPTLSVVPLDPVTARALRSVARRLEVDTARRDELIVRAKAEGASLRDIAAVVGINYVTVRNILKRIEAEK